MISLVLLERRTQAATLVAALVALIVVAFGSVAVLHFENDFAGANIHSAEDALWWSLSTVATVGYGDKYPVTSEGRFVGILLMTAGVGLFATLSGSLAAWFLGPRGAQRDQELHAIREELHAVRGLLEERHRTER
jgi:voltage-gated potassium channel